MGIKFTRCTAVEPVIGADAVADITREAFILVWRKEGEVERVVVGLVEDGQRLGSAEDVDIKIAGTTMVGEAVALTATGIAVEVAFWVGWVR